MFETECELNAFKLTAELKRRWCLGGSVNSRQQSPKLIMFMLLVELFLFQRIVVKEERCVSVSDLWGFE